MTNRQLHSFIDSYPWTTRVSQYQNDSILDSLEIRLMVVVRWHLEL